MRSSLTSIFLTLPLFTWAVTPTPATALNGNFVLNGAGSTIDATTLASTVGYFMQSGSIALNNVTFKNFFTVGGAGSGGGAGMGGVLFVNSGVTATINNVSFLANSVQGGLGGVGTVGGSLNNDIIVPTSPGTNGANGGTVYTLASLFNNANGVDGRNGFIGGNAINGPGGNAGNGGNGGDGTGDSVQIDYQLAADAAGIASTIAGAVQCGILTGSLAALEFPLAAILGFTADPFLAGFADAQDAVNQAINIILLQIDAIICGNHQEYIATIQILGDILAAAIDVTAFELAGSSGVGAPGGDGNFGGNGSFGFGGGAGGNGGNGGDAFIASVALGGNGGTGGNGGNGGFGGGGGSSGQGGQGGNNGFFAFVESGVLQGQYGNPGFGGFGAGNGTEDGNNGGGGSGLGGAIFLAAGGILNFTGPAFFGGNDALDGGSTNSGFPGLSAGTDLFMMTGSTVTFNPGAGHTITFLGTIADDSAATSDVYNFVPRGSGAGVLVESGLVIFGGVNTYSGQTHITGGVLQAADGVGIDLDSNIFLAGGILQGEGILTRYLGTQPNRIQFAPGIASGFSSAGGDFTVILDGGIPIVWGAPFFLTSGVPFLFGSASATNNVIFTNPLNLAGATQTILATANALNTNIAILAGVISNGSLTIGDVTHTGNVELSAANTYVGPTIVNGGTVILTGSLLSPTVTINTGATFQDVNGGLLIGTALTVNGTFIINANQIIGDLEGTGVIELNCSVLTVNSGTFSGVIESTCLTGGLTKTTGGTLTLSGNNTFLGPTLLLGGILDLTGTLQSETVTTILGTVFNDVNGGLGLGVNLINGGIFNLGANDTINTLVNTGTINGFGFFLTANTYLLNNGSIINAGLGPGILTTNGTVLINGPVESTNITINLGSTLTLGAAGLLLDVPDVTVNGTFVLNGNEVIGELFGSGDVSIQLGSLTLESGSFTGVISGSNPIFGIIKNTTETVTIFGNNTYIGFTDINAGVFDLFGSLDSLFINIAIGALFIDEHGGLSNLTTVTNAGTLNFFDNDTIFALINSGTINGFGFTLTALTYLLENNSFIFVNLGPGVVTTTGTVNIFGSVGANIVNIDIGSTLIINGSQLLSSGATVNVDGTLIINGATQIINILNGTNGTVIANFFQINNGGNFTGSIFIDTFDVNGGTLIINNSIFDVNTLIVNNGSIFILEGGFSSTVINSILIENNSTLEITNNETVNVHTNITIENNSFFDVFNGSTVIIGGNIFLDTGSTINIDASSFIQVTDIVTEVNTFINVVNSSSLIYLILEGNATINNFGNTFINTTTIEGSLTFINNLTDIGIINLSNNIDTLTIDNNYTEGGTVETLINNTNNFSQIRIGGNVTLLSTSILDVFMNSNAFVFGNSFQFLSNLSGGSISVNGNWGEIFLFINGVLANSNTIIFDTATGQIIVIGTTPFPPGPPGPPSPIPFETLCCTCNGLKVSNAIFKNALINGNQINSNTVAGKIAKQVLLNSNQASTAGRCKAINTFIPTFYGCLADFAFMGDRALASRVWDRVTVFADLPDHCRPRVSGFAGYLESNQHKLHKCNLDRQDIYGGADYSTCKGFSFGATVTDTSGKVKSHKQHGKSDVDGNAAMIYFRKTIGEYVTAFGTVSGSFLDNHIHRHTLFGKVKSRTETKAVTGFLGLQIDALKYEQFSFAPRVNMVYSQAHVRAFSEKGEIDALHDGGFNAKFLTGELGFSALYTSRYISVEGTCGVEQPFMSHKNKMHMYVVADPNISYPVYLSQSTKTKFSGGLNLGSSPWKRTTFFLGYEVVSGGVWDHIFNTGVRISL